MGMMKGRSREGGGDHVQMGEVTCCNIGERDVCEKTKG